MSASAAAWVAKVPEVEIQGAFQSPLLEERSSPEVINRLASWPNPSEVVVDLAAVASTWQELLVVLLALAPQRPSAALAAAAVLLAQSP